MEFALPTTQLRRPSLAEGERSPVAIVQTVHQTQRRPSSSSLDPLESEEPHKQQKLQPPNSEATESPAPAAVARFSPVPPGFQTAPILDQFPEITKLSCLYTSCYCEENIWHLASRLAQLDREAGHTHELFVVFISNSNRQVLLWAQASARPPASYAIWDYHVILLSRHIASQQVIVYDFDTTLNFPVALDEYLWRTFRPFLHMDPHFSSYFRIIPASDFLATFSSDRSHMRSESGGWQAEPPPYPPILKGDQNNLFNFIDMTNTDDNPVPGIVTKLPGLLRMFNVTLASETTNVNIL